MNVPWIAVGNDELGGSLEKGELIPCPRQDCDQNHDVRLGTKDGVEDATLMFVKCGDSTYLVGIKGRRMPLRRNSHE